ncbi:MAG: glycerol-3-phosphate acyltransferase, partial [Thermoanaerobaculia bacterium]|nr:glycerol-3-phosphate acyltransferase [Thermoanaerobaculia bacterium]
GPKAALLALALDILKGALPVVAIVAWLGPSFGAWAALGAVCGHVFSIFLRLRGGKGVATAAGALGAVSPLVLGIAAALFVAVVATTRIVSLGSILAATAFPVIMWLLAGRSWTPELAPVVLIAVLIVARHHANIGRLLRGEESRMGDKARRPPAAGEERR